MRGLLCGVALALAALPGAAGARQAGDPDGEAALAKMLAGRTAGAPVHCLPSYQLGGSTVIDRTAIVYRVGSKLYVNRPRAGADRLNDDDILVIKYFGTDQLCNVDKIDLVDRGSRFWSGFVLLGDFVPYTKPNSR